MENPAIEITDALVRVLNPASTDAQVAAIKEYFAPDACLSHPLCFIEPSPHSRERIIRAYLFLNLIAPVCTAKIRRQSFNDTKGNMSLVMEMTPALRGSEITSKLFGWQLPAIPMHVFLTLKREFTMTGPWKVHKLEVIVQPIDVLNALGLIWVAKVVYFNLWLWMIAIVIVGQIARVWTNKGVSLRQECFNLINDAFSLFFLPPLETAVGSMAWTKGALEKGVGEIKTTIDGVLRPHLAGPPKLIGLADMSAVPQPKAVLLVRDENPGPVQLSRL